MSNKKIFAELSLLAIIYVMAMFAVISYLLTMTKADWWLAATISLALACFSYALVTKDILRKP